MTRPLPEVNAQNEFFWTVGRRRPAAHPGVLLLLRADPPAQAGLSVLPRPRPGRAGGVRRRHAVRLHVNHRFQLPGLPSPYVVAQVALEEDPRVKLTTRIVEANPTSCELGMPWRSSSRVRGRSERLAAPLPPDRREQPEPLPLPEDDRAPSACTRSSGRCAPPASSRTTSASPASACPRMGRRLMVPPLSLTVEACEAAVADAGLTMDDIDGLSTYPGGAVESGFSEGGVTALEAALGSGRPGTTAAARHLRPRRIGHRGDAGRARPVWPPRAVLPDAVAGFQQR